MEPVPKLYKMFFGSDFETSGYNTPLLILMNQWQVKYTFSLSGRLPGFEMLVTFRCDGKIISESTILSTLLEIIRIAFRLTILLT